MTGLPRRAARLPDDFAAALGHAVAGFGFLEEALKRGIHALSLEDLGETPSEAEVDAWVTRMAQITGDSLGTLIDSFLAGLDRQGIEGAARRRLTPQLHAVRDSRNMLAHASWQPTGDGGWRPGFVSNRGKPVPERMDPSDLEAIRRQSADVAAEVLALARATGQDGWTLDGQGSEEAAERARAKARAARAAARRPRG